MNPIDILAEDREACLRVLQAVSEDPALIDADERFKALVAKIHREGKRGMRRTEEQRRQTADRQTRMETGLARAQREEAFRPDAPIDADLEWGVLETPASCYVCKALYTRVHPWYHMLCPECAEWNAAKRDGRADLSGRTALVTGGRIKIGFALALRMLRDGARVIVTTRFPADAARRFRELPDWPDWGERLRIVSLDLRCLPDVERFAQNLIAEESSLDILINNAAQTVKRPLAFYQHLLDAERAALGSEQNILGAEQAAFNSNLSLFKDDASAHKLLESWPGYPTDAMGMEHFFPDGLLDGDGQQVDMRPMHSWRLRLDEVGTLEMLEVYLVNAAAPFLLNSQLKPLMLRSPFLRRFIVNVSAMEGQFARESKTVFHPHTNMAKAALNMMTRTSAADYARDGIYMNSVDTGWVTDENPHPQKMRAREERSFWTPLDVGDAVARIYDPIVQGVTYDAEPAFGHFLKDYKPYAW